MPNQPKKPMKNIFNTILSFFGFGNKNVKTAPIKPNPPASPSNMNYWEQRGLMNTISLREHLEKMVKANNNIENTPIKCDLRQVFSYDLSIDTNLILPFRSQTDKVIQLFLWNILVSTNESKKVGLSRLPKIVSELRKKGWGIKTFVFYHNGKKQDVIYVLIDNSDEMLGAETYVVK